MNTHRKFSLLLAIALLGLPSCSDSSVMAPELKSLASADLMSGAAPLTVEFTGSAVNGAAPYSYSWDFGDGGSDDRQSPSHTYSAAGVYSATLTVSDSGGETARASVTITVSLTCTASAGPTIGPAPLTVGFSGLGLGGTDPITYSWEFGDGDTSVQQHPSHTYQNEGNYTATLTIRDSTGASCEATLAITVQVPSP